MPQGKGTYGSQVGRPKKKTMLKGKQKNLPPALKKKIMDCLKLFLGRFLKLIFFLFLF